MARIHRDQLTLGERRKLIRAVAEAPVFTTAHMRRRADQKGIKVSEAIDAVRTGLLIEAHDENDGELTLLFRDVFTGVCAAYMPASRSIRTVYRNACDDNHATLNKAVYTNALFPALRAQLMGE